MEYLPSFIYAHTHTYLLSPVYPVLPDRVDTSQATVADWGRRILLRELQTSLASVPPPTVTTIMAATMTTTGDQEDRTLQASQKLLLQSTLSMIHRPQ